MRGGPLAAAYFWSIVVGLLAAGVVATSVVVYPVCLVRARGNLKRAARMEIEFIYERPWSAITIALAVAAGAWFARSHFYEPDRTGEGRPYATEWSVQRTTGGGTSNFPSDTKALGFACHTALIDHGFVLRSDRGYEEAFEPGSDICHWRY